MYSLTLVFPPPPPLPLCQSLPEVCTKPMRRRRRPIRRVNSGDDFGKYRRYGQLLCQRGHTHHLCAKRKKPVQRHRCSCRDLFLPTNKTPRVQKRLTLRKRFRRSQSLNTKRESHAAIESCLNASLDRREKCLNASPDRAANKASEGGWIRDQGHWSKREEGGRKVMDGGNGALRSERKRKGKLACHS